MVGEIEILEPKIAETIVDADATSATVSWRYSKHVCDSVTCRTWYVYGTISREIPLTPNTTDSAQTISGYIIWNDIDLNYKIIQKPIASEECGCNDITITYYGDIIDVWLEDNSIYVCGGEDDGKRTLYYTYPKITNGTYQKSMVITSHTDIELSSDVCNSITETTVFTFSKEVTLEDGSKTIVKYTYTVTPPSTCIEGDNRLELEKVEYINPSIDYSGGTVSGSVYYKEYTLHKDCSSTYQNKVYEFTWDIESGECATSSCANHYETSSVTISSGDKTLKVPITVLVKGDDGTFCDNCKPQEECEISNVEYTIGDVLTYYKYYDKEAQMDKWVSAGTISPYDYQEIIISQYGGDIMGKFQYSCTTEYSNCDQKITSGSSQTTGHVSAITCVSESTESALTSGFTSTTKYGDVIIEYKQEQNKCEDEPSTSSTVTTVYTAPSPFSCTTTGIVDVNIVIEDVTSTYDQYGNFISASTSPHNPSSSTIQIDFGSEINCNSERTVSAFTESGFSITQLGGCECHNPSGITINIAKLSEELIRSGETNTWYIPCCKTGDVPIKIYYDYKEYQKYGDTWLPIIEDFNRTSATTFENANESDAPSGTKDIIYQEFNIETGISEEKKITITDVGNCCSTIIINISDT